VGPGGPAGPAGPADPATVEVDAICADGGGGGFTSPCTTLIELIRLPLPRVPGLAPRTPFLRALSVHDASVQEASVQDASVQEAFGLLDWLPLDVLCLATMAAGAPRPTARAAVDAIARVVMSDRRITTPEVTHSPTDHPPYKG
jgi:hypothetical protein